MANIDTPRRRAENVSRSCNLCGPPLLGTSEGGQMLLEPDLGKDADRLAEARLPLLFPCTQLPL